MRKIILLIFISLSAYCQTPSILASTNLGGNGTDEIIKSIKTSDGNIVMIGTTTSNTGSFSTNHGGKDILLRKVDLSGNIIWTKLYGGSADDTGVDVVEEVNGDLTFVANTNSSDGDIVIPTDPDIPWESPGYIIFRISSNATSIISQNNLFTTYKEFFGNSVKAFGFTSNSDETKTVIIKPNGAQNGGRYAQKIATYNYSNNAFTVNQMGETCGSTIFSQIITLSDGGFIAIGTLDGYTGVYNQPYGSTNGCGAKDILVVKYSSTGTIVWKKFFGGTLDDVGVGVQEINGSLYIVGNSSSTDGTMTANSGGSDIWIGKLDLDGNLLSSTRIGTANADEVYSIRKSTSNQFSISGSKGFEIFYAKLNEFLSTIEQYSGYNFNNGYSAKDIVESGGNAYLLSDHKTTVGGDIFLLKLGAAPPITIGTISPTSLCYGSNISVPFTTTLPSGTTYTVKLKKGTTVYATSTGTTSPINIQVPYSSSIGYGIDYFVEVSSGTNVSSPSNALTVGAIYSASLYDVAGNNYYSSTICNGSSLYIFAKASGYAGFANPNELTFKWYKNNVLIPSETNSSLLVNSAGSYHAVVSQGSCSYSSNSASVSFSNTIYAYNNYYGEPVACSGTTKKIEANFISNQATYQWYKDNVLISGATSKVHNASSSGLYNVKVTDGTCIAYSGLTKLSFVNGIPVNIYVYNNDTTICGNQSKYLQMNSYDNSLTYQYQWQKNGVDIANATSLGYNTSQAGKYRLKVTQGTCTSYSKEKEIIQSSVSQKPNITAPYTKICSGSLNLQSDAYGAWFKDGVTLNNSNYSFSATTTGLFKQVVSAGTSCQNESNPVSVTIGQLDKPQIKYVGSTNICGTDNTDFVRLYSDPLNMNGTVNRQWKKDGAVLSGEIYNYIIGSAAYTTGSFTLVFTNGACTSESDPVIVTQSAPAMKITNFDNNLLCSNRAVKLSVEGLGYNTTYSNNKTWYKDGILIPNETSSNIYLTAAGVYTASINSNGCIGTSTPFEIKSGPPTGFIADPIGVVNAGNTASINISNCIGDIKWYDAATGGSSISSANPFTTPTLSQNTSYWVTCTKEYCESARVQVNVIVENPCPTEIIHNGTVNAKEYITSGSIQATTNLPTGVKYNAKTNILLSPGFQVGENEVFEAVIGGCDVPVIPTNGLILHLPCDGDANDASGNNNNGAVSGATLGIDRFGIANKAYRFNDGNSIVVPNSSSLNLTDAFTFSVWVNMQSTTGRDGNGAISTNSQQCIFTKNCDYGQLRSAINPQPNGTFILQTYANDGDQATIPFQLNQWKLISLVYDGSTLKQFVNGNLASTKTVALNLAITNSYDLVIGNMGCWVYYFNGFIDDFRMYNRALSDAEVLDIYNVEKP